MPAAAHSVMSLPAIPPGTRASLAEPVTPERTVGHRHPGWPLVYGTPMMIELMEIAAATAIGPWIPDGWISVGARVDVRHLRPTPVGRTVTARAEVTDVDARRVVFRVEAHDGVALIGEGTHVRVLVERAAFERSGRDGAA